MTDDETERLRQRVAELEAFIVDQQQRRDEERAERDATIRRLSKKVKRLQGELPHDQFCRADEKHELDSDHCNTCMTLEDFGITEDDLALAEQPAICTPEAERGAAEFSLNQLSIIIRLVNDYMIQNDIVYGKSQVHTELIDALVAMKQRALDATSATEIADHD